MLMEGIRDQTAVGMVDFRDFCGDLEPYLFNTVHFHFKERGYLDAFDFFCIVIWKANRAKSKIFKRLMSSGAKSIEDKVRELTTGIYKQSNAKERLRVLWESGLRLPTASAILAVLYPDDFTVYDYRTCDMLKVHGHNFYKLSNVSNFDRLWLEYQDFRSQVIKYSPENLTLRDKDRYLWGKSFYEQLKHELTSGFIKDNSDTQQN